ncbi:hypothetical protein D3C81_195460 [compost metagenome]
MAQQFCGFQRHQIGIATCLDIDDDRRAATGKVHPESPIIEDHFEAVTFVHIQGLMGVQVFQVGQKQSRVVDPAMDVAR